MRNQRFLITAMLAVMALCLSPDPAFAAVDSVVAQLGSGHEDQVKSAVADIRRDLVGHPQHAVDRLNEDWMVALLAAKQYPAVEEIAVVVRLDARCPTRSALRNDPPG